MKPIKFKQANSQLNASAGTEHFVQPLPVFRDGLNVISCWELDDDEIETILRTKRLYISIASGPTAPPILPFVEEDNVPTFKYVVYMEMPGVLPTHHPRFIVVRNDQDLIIPTNVSFFGIPFQACKGTLTTMKEHEVVFYFRPATYEEQLNWQDAIIEETYKWNIDPEALKKYRSQIPNYCRTAPLLIHIQEDGSEVPVYS